MATTEKAEPENGRGQDMPVNLDEKLGGGHDGMGHDIFANGVPPDPDAQLSDEERAEIVGLTIENGLL